MMERQIISYNMAGWNWRLTDEAWKSRMQRSFDYIHDRTSGPMLIGLQEVQLCGGKALDTLSQNFPEYHIVLPDKYAEHQRSVISILLIRKDVCDSYSVGKIENMDECLRYNFVTLNTTDGLCFRVININIPHTCYRDKAEWFQKDRKTLRENCVEAIKALAATYKNEPDVKFIVLGDFNTTPDDPFIEQLAYSWNSPMIDSVEVKDRNKLTWKNLDSKNRLDYILYSKGMLYDTGLSAKITTIDETTISDKMSDHAMLVGGILY